MSENYFKILEVGKNVRKSTKKNVIVKMSENADFDELFRILKFRIFLENFGIQLTFLCTGQFLTFFDSRNFEKFSDILRLTRPNRFNSFVEP